MCEQIQGGEMYKTLLFLGVIAVLLLAACGGAPAAAPTTAPPAAQPTAVPPTTASEQPTAVPPTTAAEQPTAVPQTPIPTPAVTALPGATQITFWSWVPSIAPQVDEFNRTHPDIY